MKLTPKTIAMNIRRTCGKTLSHVSTSFENRFNIRPSGVTSKNVIGKRRTALSKIECIPFAAAIVPSENVSDTMNCATTEKIQIIAQCSREEKI
ncbi:CLUMA_CG013704, isoform A [Clunio marinus]|uniref:CLUMA_CG013704, isoform A n=1 Tax=Clunio marinus TaxID=568069 RepID=A0A1J1IPL5_9DIPT|nr:CLUMA_CG013704, isoform A [Clunio marinus]